MSSSTGEANLEDGVQESRLEIDGRVGILARPKEPASPLGRRAVVILHGHAGHKNYCYQRLLGRELATHGFTSFRFDFRSNGDSKDVPDSVRSFERDYEDLDVVLGYLRTDLCLEVYALVGHSRGSLAALLYCVHKDRTIPLLVNCSGRYRVEYMAKKIDRSNPGWREARGFTDTLYRHGKRVKQFIPSEEILRLSRPGTMDAIKYLPQSTHVLTIYGLADTVIPLEDCAYYSNAIGSRHSLHLLPNADHNFYGRVGEEKVNYNPKVVELILNWISDDSSHERFLQQNQYIGAWRRWLDIPGVANFRDFGGYVVHGGMHIVKRGWLYRCADLSKVQPRGKARIKELGIKRVYDLRSDPELKKNGFAEIPSVQRVATPIFKNHDYSPAKFAERFAMYSGGVRGFLLAYKSVLENGGPAYRVIFEHLRDRPEEGLLVHCTAGKDRTGVICALILALAGCAPDAISREYELTTFGLAGEHESILMALSSDTPSANKEAIMSLLSSKYATMRLTLAMIDEDYGGAAGYLRQKCGMTEDDVRCIKKNLLVKRADDNSTVGWTWRCNI